MQENIFNFIVLISTILILSSDCASNTDRTRGFIPGNFIIGALFPIHKNVLCCKKVIDEYDGIQIAEAAFFAVDMINNKTDILPNVTLGIDIRDYGSDMDVCSIKRFVLRDLLNGKNENPETSEYRASRLTEESISPLIGVIGPNDNTSVQLDLGFSDARVVYIAYSAPFSNFFKFGIDQDSYLYSTVPENKYMTEAILDILSTNNWTFVSLVYTSKDSFGTVGVKNFKELAPARGVCVAGSITDAQLRIVASDDGSSKFYWETEIRPALQNVDVIVCYCSSDSMNLLFKLLKEVENRKSKRFVVISGDGWFQTHDYSTEDIAVGEIRLVTNYARIKKFDDYFLNLNLRNNQRNPWFAEFWQRNCESLKESNCSVNSKEIVRKLKFCKTLKSDFLENLKQTSIANFDSFVTTEWLKENYKQNPKVSYVIESVFILAYALHEMLQNQSKVNHSDFLNFSAERYKPFVDEVDFEFYEQRVAFGKLSKGPAEIRYNVLNLQYFEENGTKSYVQVGQYKRTEEDLFKNDNLKIFGKIMYPPNITFRNTCHAPCPSNETKKLKSDNCCWECKACEPKEVFVNSTHCLSCLHGVMFTSDGTAGCVRIPVEHIRWFGAPAIIMSLVSTFTIVLVVFTLIIFIKHRHTPVVKSSTKELCYIMFIGMIAANLATFVIITDHTVIGCIVFKMLPPISLTFIYAALLVKTNRIARILAISKKKFPNLYPRFLTLKAQLFFTIILISIEVLICWRFMYYNPIEMVRYVIPRDHSRDDFRKCPLSEGMRPGLELLGYPIILILLCTYFAFKTRNLPENFNEAKYIGFAMYASDLTFIASGFTYVGSEFKILTISLAISITTLVVLIFLFAPKLYVLLWIPEKNTRENFVNSTDIRCSFPSQSRSN